MQCDLQRLLAAVSNEAHVLGSIQLTAQRLAAPQSVIPSRSELNVLNYQIVRFRNRIIFSGMRCSPEELREWIAPIVLQTHQCYAGALHEVDSLTGAVANRLFREAGCRPIYFLDGGTLANRRGFRQRLAAGTSTGSVSNLAQVFESEYAFSSR